jgi:hypothetical protein
LRLITIPRKIIPLAATTVLAKILAAAGIVAMIAAETGAAIAAVVAVGDAVADVLAADALKAARAAGAICPPRNMLPRKAASPADMTIAADSRAVTTTVVRKLRVPRRLQRLVSPRKRSFSPVNRSQNIVASPPLRLRPFRVSNMKHAKIKTLSKKLRRVLLATFRPPLPAAAASLAASPAVCRAGF